MIFAALVRTAHPDEMVDSRDDSDSEEQIGLFPDPEGYYKPRPQPTSISFTRNFASAPYSRSSTLALIYKSINFKFATCRRAFSMGTSSLECFQSSSRLLRCTS